MTDPIISFQHVRVRFNQHPVLDDISFDILPGEFVCLLGASGSGKSTALRLMGNLLDGYEGVVTINSHEPSRAWSKLAYVFQSPRLVHWRSALGNVVLGMELRGSERSKPERQRHALEWLEKVGLSADAMKYPSMMSGGEKQRVSIARALAVDPDVLLMDEPFASLDVNTRQRLRDEILRIWQESKKTVVFVTHDLDEALYLADRIILFSNKPTRVLKVYSLSSPRPRSVDIGECLNSVKREITALFGSGIGGNELTDGER